MGLSNAERQARKYQRTKERLAEVERLKARIAELERSLEDAVTARLADLSPNDLLTGFRTLPTDEQCEFLGGLWREVTDRAVVYREMIMAEFETLNTAHRAAKLFDAATRNLSGAAYASKVAAITAALSANPHNRVEEAHWHNRDFADQYEPWFLDASGYCLGDMLGHVGISDHFDILPWPEAHGCAYFNRQREWFFRPVENADPDAWTRTLILIKLTGANPQPYAISSGDNEIYCAEVDRETHAALMLHFPGPEVK